MRYMTHTGRYNSIGGIGLEKLRGTLIVGTTPSTADEPLLKRPSSPYKNIPLVATTDSEGTYIEDVDIVVKGFNFPVAKAAPVTTNSTSLQKVVSLTSSLVVGIYTVGTKLYAIAGTVASSGAITWGSAVTVNNAETKGADICKVSSTLYAISYNDSGGSSYLCVRMGSVDGTTITQGDEKEVVADTLDALSGTAICLANTLTLAVAYSLDADGKGLLIAVNYVAATMVVSTGGTAVEFDGGDDTKELSICSHTTGDVAVVYQAGGDADDPITMCCATVSTAKAIVCGDEVSMAGATGAATGIDCVAIGKDRVAFTWIDATKLHINMATISTTTPTKKTELELTTTAALTPRITNLDGGKVAIAYEDDANTNDVGKVVVCSVSDTTWTKVVTNQFTRGSICTPGICTLTADRILLFFEDDASTTDKIGSLIGQWDNYLIDIRGNAASKPFSVWIGPCQGKKRSA